MPTRPLNIPNNKNRLCYSLRLMTFSAHKVSRTSSPAKDKLRLRLATFFSMPLGFANRHGPVAPSGSVSAPFG